MSTATYKCASCGGDFTARTADRARGWARFCSMRCKATKQEACTGQHRAHIARQQDDEPRLFSTAHLFDNCEK